MEEIEKDLIDIAAVLDKPADNPADMPASEDLDKVIDSKISEMEEILDDDTETEIDAIEMAPVVEDSTIENPVEVNEVIDEIEEIVDNDTELTTRIIDLETEIEEDSQDDDDDEESTSTERPEQSKQLSLFSEGKIMEVSEIKTVPDADLKNLIESQDEDIIDE